MLKTAQGLLCALAALLIPYAPAAAATPRPVVLVIEHVTVVPMTVSAVFPTFTGNVQVGLCYETGDTNWNKNGRMFVKTLQL